MITSTTDPIQAYINTAKTKQQYRLNLLEKRRADALKIALVAANLLKIEFLASRIVLFGSVLEETFHETSDIDLAVWDLPEKTYFKAVSKLLALSEFEFDLVEIQYATPEILAAIAKGQEL